MELPIVDGLLEFIWHLGSSLFPQYYGDQSEKFKSLRQSLACSWWQCFNHMPFTLTIDALLFGGLAVISVLITASQSMHIAQILIFLIPAVIILILLCWRCKPKAANIFATLHRQIKKSYKFLCEPGEDDDHRPLLGSPQSISISHTVIDI